MTVEPLFVLEMIGTAVFAISGALAASRAKLCAATAGALKLGLSTILGIPVVDRM